MNPGMRDSSVFFGPIVVAPGFALRVAPRPGRRVAAIAILGLCSLAVLGYAGFVGLGFSGMPQQDSYGDPITVTFTPAIGICLAVAGSIFAVIAAIRSFIHGQA